MEDYEYRREHAEMVRRLLRVSIFVVLVIGLLLYVFTH